MTEPQIRVLIVDDDYPRRRHPRRLRRSDAGLRRRRAGADRSRGAGSGLPAAARPGADGHLSPRRQRPRRRAEPARSSRSPRTSSSSPPPESSTRSAPRCSSGRCTTWSSPSDTRPSRNDWRPTSGSGVTSTGSTAHPNKPTSTSCSGCCGPLRSPPPAQRKGTPRQRSSWSATPSAPAGDISATEVSEKVGISRATAQRYLSYLERHGVVKLHLRYGTTGRPENRYRMRTG